MTPRINMAQFSDELQTIRETYRAKRNFMKLLAILANVAAKENRVGLCLVS